MTSPSISVSDYLVVGLPGFLMGGSLVFAISIACKKFVPALIDQVGDIKNEDEYKTATFSPRYFDNALLLAVASFSATKDTVIPNSENPSDGPISAFLALAIMAFAWHFFFRIASIEEYRRIPLASKLNHIAAAFRNWKISILQSLISLAGATACVGTIAYKIFSFG